MWILDLPISMKIPCQQTNGKESVQFLAVQLLPVHTLAGPNRLDVLRFWQMRILRLLESLGQVVKIKLQKSNAPLKYWYMFFLEP